MSGHKEEDPAKEKKRKKALKRMAKILSKAWEIPNAKPFQISPKPINLGDVGDKLDAEAYSYGRAGWEDFARDIGSVYGRHIYK